MKKVIRLKPHSDMSHYWFSRKKEESDRSNTTHPHRFICYAHIGDKKVRYNLCTEWYNGAEHGTSWNDMKYLGAGTFSHAEPYLGEDEMLSVVLEMNAERKRATQLFRRGGRG